MVELQFRQSATAVSGGPDEDPVSVARRRLSPYGAHIVLDVSKDVNNSAVKRVSPLAEISLWIERLRFNADPLVRGWYGPLVREGNAARQEYFSCSCEGCQKPLEIRHVGLDTRDVAGEVLSYELTYRKFVGCGKCSDCASSQRRVMVLQTVAEMHHALEHGQRVWWGTLTFKPHRYDEAIVQAKAAFEDPDPDSKQSSAGRTLRERFSEGAPPDWSKLAGHEQDRLVLDVLYPDVQAYLQRIRDKEWQGDDRDGMLRTRSEHATHRYLVVAEVAGEGSRGETLRKRGVDPASLGPGKRMVHIHLIVIAGQGELSKRTLAQCWRLYGGGHTDFELLTESEVKAKATYIAGYAHKGPLVRSEQSANWGLCVPRGTGKKAKQAIRAARLAQRQADRLDGRYQEAIRYDLEERAAREQRVIASRDALVAGVEELAPGDRQLARFVAQRMIDHHEDTIDEPFIRDEPPPVEGYPAAALPDRPSVDMMAEAMWIVAEQPPHGPVRSRIRDTVKAVRLRRKGAAQQAARGSGSFKSRKASPASAASSPRRSSRKTRP